MEMNPITISGASGFLGSSLALYLRQLGLPVQTLVRRPPQSKEEIFWNPTESRLDSSQLRNSRAIIHLGGENLADGRWTQAKKERILLSRTQSTKLLAETLASFGPQAPMFICASGTGFYGERGEQICDEAMEPGNDFLAMVCKQWEAAAEPARRAGIRVIHMRLGVVLDKTGGALQKMLPIFRLGLGGRLGRGTQFLSWIDLRDLHRIVAWLLQQPNIDGPVNCTSPNPTTNQEFTRILGQVLRRPTFLTVPKWALNLGLGEMSSALLTSIRASPQVLNSAGFRFEHSNLLDALTEQIKS